MILNHLNFFSKSLLNHVDVNVLIPNMPDNDTLSHSYDEIYRPRKCKVLYLLHGALDDYSQWLRQTEIERFAEETGIAVVMPSGQNGFYTDAVYGLKYFTYVTEELPRMIEYLYPVSSRREDRFIAGPSMGGYGATKLALNCPERYAAFADLSGAVNPKTLKPRMEAMGFGFFRYDLVFGGVEKVEGNPKHDLYLLADQLREQVQKPRAFITCGLEDTNNYDMNYRLYEKLQQNGFDAAFHGGHGEHNWIYWNECIALFIKQYMRD